MAEVLVQATMLRNEPEIFAARFWRDFYRALLSNAARSAMTTQRQIARLNQPPSSS